MLVSMFQIAKALYNQWYALLRLLYERVFIVVKTIFIMAVKIGLQLIVVKHASVS